MKHTLAALLFLALMGCGTDTTTAQPQCAAITQDFTAQPLSACGKGMIKATDGSWYVIKGAMYDSTTSQKFTTCQKLNAGTYTVQNAYAPHCALINCNFTFDGSAISNESPSYLPHCTYYDNPSSE